MNTSFASFIKSSSTFRRVAAAGVVASALVGSAVAPAHAGPCYFGECERAPATAAKSDFKVIARNGTWTAKTNGTTTFVTDRFDDGAEFTVADKNGEIYVIFTYDGWHWQEGKKFPVKISVDGDTFNGTVEALSGTMLVSDHVKGTFIKAFFKASKVKVEIAGDTFTMPVGTLKDGAATLDQAIRYQRSASR